MGRFRQLLDDLELKEIPLLGRRYSWSNECEAPTFVCLDRVFCTIDWELLFLNCILQSHATSMSDHCPLLLGLNVGVKGKRRFHFESFWTKLDGFLEVVDVSWVAPINVSCSIEWLSIKLKRLSRALQSWGHKQVGHVKHQLQMAKDVLHCLEIAQDMRILSPKEDWLRRELKRHCLGLASLEWTIAH